MTQRPLKSSMPRRRRLRSHSDTVVAHVSDLPPLDVAPFVKRSRRPQEGLKYLSLCSILATEWRLVFGHILDDLYVVVSPDWDFEVAKAHIANLHAVQLQPLDSGLDRRAAIIRQREQLITSTTRAAAAGVAAPGHTVARLCARHLRAGFQMPRSPSSDIRGRLLEVSGWRTSRGDIIACWKSDLRPSGLASAAWTGPGRRPRSIHRRRNRRPRLENQNSSIGTTRVLCLGTLRLTLVIGWDQLIKGPYFMEAPGAACRRSWDGRFPGASRAPRIGHLVVDDQRHHPGSELAGRWPQLLEAVVSDGSSRAWAGTDSYMRIETSRNGSFTDAVLRRYVADQFSRDSAIFKERRKAQEAKKGASRNATRRGRGRGVVGTVPSDCRATAVPSDEPLTAGLAGGSQPGEQRRVSVGRHADGPGGGYCWQRTSLGAFIFHVF